MTHRGDGRGRGARGAKTCRFVLAAVLWLSIGVESALAETQSVIDPVEAPEPPKPPAAKAKEPPQADARLKRERQRAQAEQRKRAKAEARALAAENEAAQLRALEQARQEDAAAKDAAAKAAARKAAAARAAEARAAAARVAKARIAAKKEAARKEAAVREAAAREAAAREAAVREAAAREAAAREAAARETAAREMAAREAAAREAAAREAAAREAAARQAAVREAAARETAAREMTAREAAAREAAAREAAAREAPAPRAQPRFGKVFRDCTDCPEVVWLPRGELNMVASSAAGGPRYAARIGYMLAVGRFKVTFAEWDACVAAGGCRRRPDDSGWGRGRQPVTNISWADAQQYAAWLSRITSKHYRLLTGPEWEYAARAGSEVYDMHGKVSEWVENCYQYRDSRSGGKWTLECTTQVVRGGAPHDPANAPRSVARSFASFDHYDSQIGFRIARTE